MAPANSSTRPSQAPVARDAFTAELSAAVVQPRDHRRRTPITHQRVDPHALARLNGRIRADRGPAVSRSTAAAYRACLAEPRGDVRELFACLGEPRGWARARASPRGEPRGWMGSREGSFPQPPSCLGASRGRVREPQGRMGDSLPRPSELKPRPGELEGCPWTRQARRGRPRPSRGPSSATRRTPRRPRSRSPPRYTVATRISSPFSVASPSGRPLKYRWASSAAVTRVAS